MFYSQFFISNELNAIKDDQAYTERVVNQIQLESNAREHWLAQYNNSVSARPQDRELVAMNAFKLLTSTDQLLTALEVAANHKGKGDSQILIDEKNRRFEDAENQLKNRDAEALVERTNRITEKHEKTVEPITKIVMNDWKNRKWEGGRWFKDKLLLTMDLGRYNFGSCQDSRDWMRLGPYIT